ncbi:MAG: type II toxin-antitoxin system VapC family toxin [SAR202 cluster bacterium]|nr:type II toxin-antitoxin system VapC family toxin [SAR202 cluster bacterium]
MCVVDASVWVSRFSLTDVFHLPSLKWLEDQFALGEMAVAPAILVVEAAGAVARRTNNPAEGTEAASLTQRVPYSRLMPMEDGLVQLGAQIAADRRLKGADALYVAMAHRLALPLVTWDRQQLGQHGHGIIVLTPQEALIGG